MFVKLSLKEQISKEGTILFEKARLRVTDLNTMTLFDSGNYRINCLSPLNIDPVVLVTGTSSPNYLRITATMYDWDPNYNPGQGIVISITRGVAVILFETSSTPVSMTFKTTEIIRKMIENDFHGFWPNIEDQWNHWEKNPPKGTKIKRTTGSDKEDLALLKELNLLL